MALTSEKKRKREKRLADSNELNTNLSPFAKGHIFWTRIEQRTNKFTFIPVQIIKDWLPKDKMFKLTPSYFTFHLPCWILVSSQQDKYFFWLCTEVATVKHIFCKIAHPGVRKRKVILMVILSDKSINQTNVLCKHSFETKTTSEKVVRFSTSFQITNRLNRLAINSSDTY